MTKRRLLTTSGAALPIGNNWVGGEDWSGEASRNCTGGISLFWVTNQFSLRSPRRLDNLDDEASAELHSTRTYDDLEGPRCLPATSRKFFQVFWMYVDPKDGACRIGREPDLNIIWMVDQRTYRIQQHPPDSVLTLIRIARRSDFSVQFLTSSRIKITVQDVANKQLSWVRVYRGPITSRSGVLVM